MDHLVNEAERQRRNRAARKAVLVLPSPELGLVEVRGNDRLTWLNGLVTCEMAKRAPGEAVYGLAVVKSGKVITDFVALIDRERVLLATPATAIEALRASLEAHLIMEDASHDVVSGAVWMAHGPRAGAVLDAARAAGAVGGALDRTGLGGAVIAATEDTRAAVGAAIDAAIAKHEGALGDADDWTALRIEAGVPAFGFDFDGATFPQEAGLEQTAVSFNKGCYLGQEVVCMLEMRGRVKRRIVPVLVDASAPPTRGTKVRDAAGVEVGEITSSAMSPALRRPVALAMVKRAASEPGTKLAVGDDRGEVAAPPVAL